MCFLTKVTFVLEHTLLSLNTHFCLYIFISELQNGGVYKRRSVLGIYKCNVFVFVFEPYYQRHIVLGMYKGNFLVYVFEPYYQRHIVVGIYKGNVFVFVGCLEEYICLKVHRIIR